MVGTFTCCRSSWKANVAVNEVELPADVEGDAGNDDQDDDESGYDANGGHGCHVGRLFGRRLFRTGCAR